MIGALLGDLWPFLVGLAGGIAALVGAWAKGKRDGRQEAARKADEAYRETRERIDAVDVGDDPALLRDWLRDRGQR